MPIGLIKANYLFREIIKNQQLVTSHLINNHWCFFVCCIYGITFMPAKVSREKIKRLRISEPLIMKFMIPMTFSIISNTIISIILQSNSKENNEEIKMLFLSFLLRD